MTKRILLQIVAVFAIMFYFTDSKAQERFVFTPQWTAQAQFAGYYVAYEKGFYKEEGLDVVIEHPSATQSALKRIRSNKSQATTMMLCQAMEIVDNGIPVVNILQTSMCGGILIVSRHGKDPLTQKGERVAAWSVGFGQMAVCMSMKEKLDYEWVPFASNVNFFLSGAVDAMLAMSYNECQQLMQAGIELTDDNTCNLSEHGYNVQEDGVYMTKEYYETHKEQAKKFADASRRGWEWAAKHPEETLEIVMKYVRNNHIATNRVLQERMLMEVLKLQIDKESGKREFRLRPDMVKLASSLMVECKLLKNEVTYETLIME